MDYFEPQQFLAEGRIEPVWKKQGEFVRFLVNCYYVEPSKLIEEKRDARSGVLSGLLYRDFPFGDDVAKLMGRIAEETMLLDQKHVQEKPPFSILEKPLSVPAMVGVLLQCFFLEEYGVFISSTTFDNWASYALGFEVRLSRIWLDAQCRVHRALRNSSAKHFVDQRNAREAGVHAIEMQSRNGGALQLLWNDTYRLLCNKLCETPVLQQNMNKIFIQAVQNSITLRKKIEKVLSTHNYYNSEAIKTLYSTAEPELCACIVYHVCFRMLESIFKKETCTRDKRLFSANIMQEFFQQCLNLFTFNRYVSPKNALLSETLDAVAMLADGKHTIDRLNLKTLVAPAPPMYLRRSQLLSCDHISGEVAFSDQTTDLKTPNSISQDFTEMDTTSIDVTAMYSFDTSEQFVRGMEIQRAEIVLKRSPKLENRDDDEDYSKFTTLVLNGSNDGCEKYILSEKDRNIKKQIYTTLHGYKNR